MVRNELEPHLGQRIEIEGIVSVKYRDSGRVVIGHYDITTNGHKIPGGDHIGINPNNWASGQRRADYRKTRRGDRVRVCGEVVSYVVKGERKQSDRGRLNYRLGNVDEFEILQRVI